MYEPINGTLLGEDLSYIFVYADLVTFGFFSVFMVISFFSVILVSSLLIQFKFTSRIRPETSLLASSFATLGFAVLLEQKTGILNWVYFILLIGILIGSFIWVALSSKDT